MSATAAPRPLSTAIDPCGQTEWEAFQRAFIIVAGLAWIARAAQVWLDPDIVSPDWAVIHTALPLWLRTVLWATTGAVAIACTRLRREPIGIALLIIMPVERTISYLWSAAMWVVPGKPPGHIESLAWAAWWACMSSLVALVAAWPLLIRRCPSRMEV